jgi:RNA polymerase-binding transcription factor DksA
MDRKGPDHPHEAISAELDRKERELEGQLVRLRESLRDSLRETSGEMTIENHPGDVGTETFEREKDMGRARYLETQVAEVADAQERLAEGRYGICEQCGRPIDPERLAVRPQSARCLECEERIEGGGARG